MTNYIVMNETNAMPNADPVCVYGFGFMSSQYNTCWDDLKFPVTQVKKGANDKPDFDYTNNGMLFPQNDATEKIYIVAQFPHHWKSETLISPHIHYVQDEASSPIFKMAYRWYKNGSDSTGAFTTITTADEGGGPVFTYESGSILQIINFPDIDSTGIDTVSSIMDIIIYREDNVVTGDVLVKEFDIHYEIDSLGSATEFIK